MFKQILILFLLSSCGQEEFIENKCLGNRFAIDSDEIEVDYSCSQRTFEDNVWLDFRFVYGQIPNRVNWLYNIVTLPVKIDSIPFDIPLDASQLISELQLITINALGGTAFVASYSKSATFNGTVIRNDSINVCIKCVLNFPGMIRETIINMSSKCEGKENESD